MDRVFFLIVALAALAAVFVIGRPVFLMAALWWVLLIVFASGLWIGWRSQTRDSS